MTVAPKATSTSSSSNSNSFEKLRKKRVSGFLYLGHKYVVGDHLLATKRHSQICVAKLLKVVPRGALLSHPNWPMIKVQW